MSIKIEAPKGIVSVKPKPSGGIGVWLVRHAQQFIKGVRSWRRQ